MAAGDENMADWMKEKFFNFMDYFQQECNLPPRYAKQIKEARKVSSVSVAAHIITFLRDEEKAVNSKDNELVFRILPESTGEYLRQYLASANTEKVDAFWKKSWRYVEAFKAASEAILKEMLSRGIDVEAMANSPIVVAEDQISPTSK